MANRHWWAGLGLGRKRLLPRIHRFGCPRMLYPLVGMKPRSWYGARFAVDAVVDEGLMHCIRHQGVDVFASLMG